jgi:hypothetical protein
MKNRSLLWVVLIVAALCFTGCSTTPKAPRIVDVPYIFGQDENADGTAEIIFNYGVRFVDLEGEELPPPEEGTRWRPLLFPAGRELNIRVYAAYAGNTPGYRRRGIFTCPPLEAGKKYKIWFEPAKTNKFTGAGRLILTYDNVKELKYVLGIPRYRQIYVHQIPPL